MLVSLKKEKENDLFVFQISKKINQSLKKLYPTSTEDGNQENEIKPQLIAFFRLLSYKFNYVSIQCVKNKKIIIDLIDAFLK